MTALLDAFTIEIQRLYGLERELRSELDVLVADVSIDTLDMAQKDECRTKLRERLETHQEETETHIDRLETIFERLGMDPTTRPTPELDGWTSDKEQFNNIILSDELRPLYYLSATMRLEEIERSAYESALSHANVLEQMASADEDEATDIEAKIEGDVSEIGDLLEQTHEDEQSMLADLESILSSESVSQLLAASPMDSANRTAFHRSRH